MLKISPIFPAVFVVELLLLCVGYLYGDCPSGMIHVGSLCYKWYNTSADQNTAVRTCRKDGGDWAGAGQDFVKILQQTPELQDYLPKEYCFWAHIRHTFHDIPGYKLSKSVGWDTYATAARWIYMWLGGMKICHNEKEWKAIHGSWGEHIFFICQYDIRLFMEASKPNKVKQQRMAIRTMHSALISGTPLFVQPAPVPTMCSRLCQGFAECSTFNHNRVTGECRGFDKRKTLLTNHHAEWEVWVLDWVSAG